MLTDVARAAGLKTIATNDFHYLTREDAKAQDYLLCISTGAAVNDANRMRFENDQFYMKSEEEMREALKDFPEACDTTVEVAEKCDVVLERDSILPRFPLPEGETEESYFRRRVQEGLVKHYGDPVPPEAQERADYEMSVIVQQGFPAYFLIVQEYIEWARSQGIGVGPGRGSAAGAIVAYAMDITALDPLSNGLLFERFLSPERVEMPDIDVDFEQGRREEVINHIKDVYGEDHVSQVITFGTLQAKNAVRDAARVLDYPYNTGDRICKMIGDELGITIDKALATNPDLKKAYESEEDVKQVIDAAKSLEGHVRGEGVHACATIICRDPMADHVPMKRDTKGGGIITQYDGHYTPELGLLKMDFLGLRTLDVLTMACRNIEQRFGTKVIPEDIPIDDEAAFKLMQSGNMDGLFQVEGALYVSLFSRLPPTRFSDIVASIALNRPGPLESGMVDDYVKVASGKTAIHYYDERLRPILEETYGTMVYQEQIMQISMAMSGFSAGKADKLRKAMGKKKLRRHARPAGGLEHGRGGERLLAGDREADLGRRGEVREICLQQVALGRLRHPGHAHGVLEGALSERLHGGRAVQLHGQHRPAHPLHRQLQPFGHTRSAPRHQLVQRRVHAGGRRRALRAGGRARRGQERRGGDHRRTRGQRPVHQPARLREPSGRQVLQPQDARGPHQGRGVRLDGLHAQAAMYFVDETPLLEGASKRQKDRDRGQVSMFDLFGDDPDSGFEEEVPEPDGVEWDKRTKLAYEKEIMKIYVSEHPLQPYEGVISRMTKFQLGDLAERTKEIKSAVFVGMVSGVVTKLTKRGTKMATFNLEDTTGHIECICFKYEENAEAIQEDAIVKIKGKFEHNDRGNQIMAFEVEAIELNEEDVRPSHLELKVSSSEFDQSRSLRLNRILAVVSRTRRRGAVRAAGRWPQVPRRAARVRGCPQPRHAFRDPGPVRARRADRLSVPPAGQPAERADAAGSRGTGSSRDCEDSRTQVRVAFAIPRISGTTASLADLLANRWDFFGGGVFPRRRQRFGKRGEEIGRFRFAAEPLSFMIAPMTTETMTQTKDEAVPARGAASSMEAAGVSAPSSPKDATGSVRRTALRGDTPVRNHTLGLTVSYNGAPFSGFARQPGQLTVQGEIEQALALLFKRDVETTCAGRTDAGVHALGQVMSFDVDDVDLRGRSLPSLRRSLNALTHDAITVREVEPKPLGFSARFDAQAREYHYHLCVDSTSPIFMKDFSWFVPGGLDVFAMEAGARHLIGEHDFKSFCLAASAEGKPTHRNVREISFHPETVMGENILAIKVVGNAFLHSMVRTMVGTLVMVGKGQREPDWVREVLQACDRQAAGENAPAQGLVFWRVIY